MTQSSNGLAVVTGASSGIGRELARLAAQSGMDLIIAANDAGIDTVAFELRSSGPNVTAMQADLATAEGVDKLYSAVKEAGRPVEFLFANAGRGLGHAFLDQDFREIRQVIDTNITGTVYLLHKIGQDMRAQKKGRILITGSIAGYMPGSFQAVYNGTKAFVDSFAAALRNELKDTGVTVTCLMPGATETEFFKTADMLDTKVGSGDKDDPADVARTGFDAMMRGEASVIHGLANKAQVLMGKVLPQTVVAEVHRKQAAPGTGKP